MREPDGINMGYHNDGYGAECNYCGVIVELEFGTDERRLLTPTMKDEIAQDELYAFVFFWTLLKLERECECERFK